MTPHMCLVAHRPPERYGDCVRACIASMMDTDPEQVPHFVHDGCSGDVMQSRIREWLALHGCAPFWTHYSHVASLEDVLSNIADQNPNALYMLYGHTGEGNHVVVCKGDRIIHDPNWIKTSLKGAAQWGDGLSTWAVMVIARI